ncbi:MAG: autotransporter-associated beta strand repeat-containing protein, partial [Chlamydiota bacterium]
MKWRYLWITTTLCKLSLVYGAEWNIDNDGLWSVGSNWNPANVPGLSLDFNAVLGSVITQARTITLDQNFSLSSLSFDNTFPYTLTSNNNSSLRVGSIIAVNSGSHVIDNNLVIDGSVTVNTISGTALNVSKMVSGAGDLLKQSPGELTLSATDNTFTGDILLQGGKISVGSLGGTGSISLNTGTTFEPLSPLTTTDRPFDLVGDSTIFVDTGHTFTVDGTLSGAGALTKDGDGTLIFGTTSAGAYTAPIDIQEGTLSAASLADGGPVSLADGTTFESLAPFANSNRAFTLAGSSTIAVPAAAHVFTIRGAVTNNGTATMVKQGDGRLCLLNDANGTYEMIIEAGNFCILTADNLGGDRLTLNGGTLENIAGPILHTEELVIGPNGGTIDAKQNNFEQTGVASGSGPLTKIGFGELLLSSTSNTFTGDINLQVGKISAGSLGGTGTITITAGTTFEPLSTFPTTDRSFDVAADGSILVDNAHTFTIDGALTNTGILVKDGNGTLILGPTSAIAYTGGINIQNGRLSAASLGSTGSVLITSGTTFEALAPLATSDRDFILGRNSNISVGPGHDFTIAGAVSGIGASTMVKQGDGRLCLSNAANGTYETLVEAGTLCITEVDALGGDRVTLNG